MPRAAQSRWPMPALLSRPLPAPGCLRPSTGLQFPSLRSRRHAGGKRYQRARRAGEGIMLKARSIAAAALFGVLAVPAHAQGTDFKPVTREMLADPDPADWLMINRTYDEQRFSPLKEINRDNVG